MTTPGGNTKNPGGSLAPIDVAESDSQILSTKLLHFGSTTYFHGGAPQANIDHTLKFRFTVAAICYGRRSLCGGGRGRLFTCVGMCFSALKGRKCKTHISF